MGMKSEKEIEEMADKAAEATDKPKFFGQTYEEGVRNALEWVLGQCDESPLE